MELQKAKAIAEELESKIVSVCLQCPHRKAWMAGRFECTVKQSHCHSKRVRRWLDEIKRLEVEDESAGYSIH
jgi:hypothetical protein